MRQNSLTAWLYPLGGQLVGLGPLPQEIKRDCPCKGQGAHQWDVRVCSMHALDIRSWAQWLAILHRTSPQKLELTVSTDWGPKEPSSVTLPLILTRTSTPTLCPMTCALCPEVCNFDPNPMP